MEESGTAEDVSAPLAGDGNVDDGVEHQRVGVIIGAGGLRGFESGRAQRQVVELEVEAKSEVAVRVASGADGCNASATADEVLGVAIGEAGAASDVEGPFVVGMSLFLLANGTDFFLSFLAAAGLLAGLRGLGLGRWGGRVLCWSLLVLRWLGRGLLGVGGGDSRY